MKKLTIILMAVGLIAISSTAFAQQTNKKKKAGIAQQAKKHKYQCPMKCEGEKTYAKEGKCPVCNMKLQKLEADKPAAFYCTMKCEGEKTNAKEGKCPVCNMKLVKKETKKPKDEHEGHNHG